MRSRMAVDIGFNYVQDQFQHLGSHSTQANHFGGRHPQGADGGIGNEWEKPI